MALNRRNPRRDANEPAIIAALETADYSVVQLSDAGIPDLLVGNNHINVLMEVKSDTGRLTDAQKAFFDSWKGQKAVVRSAEEALELMENITVLKWEYLECVAKMGDEETVFTPLPGYLSLYGLSDKEYTLNELGELNWNMSYLIKDRIVFRRPKS